MIVVSETKYILDPVIESEECSHLDKAIAEDKCAWGWEWEVDKTTTAYTYTKRKREFFHNGELINKLIQ